MIRPVPVLLALSLVAPCLSQGKIYVVDVANGPGTHFRSIKSALVNAIDGDRILVRRGTYTGFVVTRGVAIIGSPGVVISSPFPNHFVGARVPAGRTFSLSNVDCHVPFDVRDCAGGVLLESVVMRMGSGFMRCKQVSLTRCSMLSIQPLTSTVVISEGTSLRELIITKGSNVTLVNTPMVGQPGWWWYGRFNPAPSPIYLDGTSNLTITGDRGTLIQGGSTTNPVIAGNGSLVLDPRVQLKNFSSSGASIGSGIRVTRRTVPYLDAQGAPLGGTVKVTLKAGAHHPFFLAVSLPGDVTSIPSLGGSVWLDLNTTVLIAAGKLDANGAYAWSIPVPIHNVLLGLALVWQGTAGPSLSQQSLSNPSAYVHGF